jgi:hypothetical protein
VSPRKRWQLCHAGTVCLLVAGVLTLAACSFGPDTPEIRVEVKSWYSSQEILIPFSVYGDSVRYGEYRYEYNGGNGWEVDIDRTIRIPDGGEGLIELTTAEPGWDHRLTFSALEQAGVGQPLEPTATTEQYFHVDTTTPSAELGSLRLLPYEADLPLPGPPYTYNATLKLEIFIHHPEFTAPSGSYVRVFFTREGSMPNEWSNDNRQDSGLFEIWPDGGSGPRDEVYRFIVIDAAGNRSGVRTMVFSAP